MLQHFSLLLVLASIWTTWHPVQGTIQVQGFSITKCRTKGIALVSNPLMNFTEAKEACKMLGLTLASRNQVELAQKNGLETCSYGWVGEQFSVIPRIQANPKCGKNGIGVLIWKAPLSQKFKAYCFNLSDTQNNSCKPEIGTTFNTTFNTQTFKAEISVSNSAYSASSPDSTTPTSATTRVPPFTSMARKTKVICNTEVYTEVITMDTEAITTDTEAEATVESGAAFKNEAAGFGGVPTALLVLALLFFGAAAALAVCYVKRYVKAFPFTNKNQQKEMIETKVVKEEKADDINANEESKKTFKNPGEPKSPPKTTVRCLEAEV